MFDFAWSEIALIGVVALIAIGPKDMPVAIRAISNTIKKLRRMAGEFQHHVDDMMKEADLGDVKSSFDELRGMNLKQTVRRTLDPDGTLKRAFDDPFAERRVPPVMTPLAEKPVPMAGPPPPPPPAFIPPETLGPGAAPPAAIPPARNPPPFIPPAAARPPIEF